MERNNLHPIFLKAENLKILIVGGGFVGEEKLHFLLKSSPAAGVKLVSKEFTADLTKLAEKHGVQCIEKTYDPGDLEGLHIVIAATNDKAVNKQIYEDARERNLLVNVADTPDLCDFYLGGVVTRGNVKIAISTNGKSPVLAKRLRQFFEEILPDSLDNLVLLLNDYRKTLKGDFEAKVKEMHKVTKGLITRNE